MKIGFRSALAVGLVAATAMFSPLAGAEASAVAISESVQPTTSTDKTPSGEIQVADDIAWQGEVEGTPGNVVSQEVGLENGETAIITVDWGNDSVSIERSDGGNSQIPLSDLQAAANSVDGDGAPSVAVHAANADGINWGNMCNWIAGVAGLGHAAIWSIVSPWIGLSYGAFWLLVNLQC